MKKIKEQYNLYTYPEPIEEMQKAIDNGYIDLTDASLFWDIFFPDKTYKDNLNVFIAGCGTNQAVYLALANPNWKIYGIDLSENSIGFVNKQIKKYNLKNLNVEMKDIFEITNKDEYDLVISTGVIHHTKDPKLALKILSSATKKDGALCIMVYAKYFRTGVYDLQKIFRYLGIKQDADGIKFVKNYIENILPDDHIAKKFYKSTPSDIDTAIIDTWLNPQDIAYDANDLKELIRGTGAYFQNWLDNLFCYPQAHFDDLKNDIDLSLLDHLDPIDTMDFTQSTMLQAKKHTFILRKKKELEFKWSSISEIKKKTRVKNSSFVKAAEKGDLSQNYGGQVFYQRFQGARCPKFSAKEGIVWSAIIQGVKNNVGSSFNDVLLLSNKIARDNNLNISFDNDEIIRILHWMWKLSIVTFSESEDKDNG
tara:strand:+ start:1735 stop:3003 length:1269 start_codon:yes stop_codon:yes gene_type:complete